MGKPTPRQKAIDQMRAGRRLKKVPPPRPTVGAAEDDGTHRGFEKGYDPPPSKTRAPSGKTPAARYPRDGADIRRGA